MIRILILLWIFYGTATYAHADTTNREISVALDRSKDDLTELVIKITNKAHTPFQFLDLQGCDSVGDCSIFYTIILRTPKGDLEATGSWYADGEFPKLIVLDPGDTHTKSIDPTAYRFPGVDRLRAPFEVAVRYSVSGKTKFTEVENGKQVVRILPTKERYSALYKGLDTSFQFQTNFIKVRE